MEGDRLVTTPYDIMFRVDKENEVLCSRELGEKDLTKFRKAVKKDYYFQVGILLRICTYLSRPYNTLKHYPVCAWFASLSRFECTSLDLGLDPW